MRGWSGLRLLIMALCALGFVQLVATGTSAQSAQEPLLLTLTQYRVIEDETEPGGERFEPSEGDEGAAGMVVEYRLTAKNVSSQPLTDLILRLLIPQGTVYLAGKEQFDRTSALLQFSIDGGQTFRTAPLRYIIVHPDGREEQAIATPDMYTDLRLVFLRSLTPGEEVTFAYRVQIQ